MSDGLAGEEDQGSSGRSVLVSHYSNLIKRFRRYTTSTKDVDASVSTVSGGVALSASSAVNTASLWRSFEPHLLNMKHSVGSGANGVGVWGVVGPAMKIECSLSLSLSYLPLSASSPHHTRAGSVVIELVLNMAPPASLSSSSLPEALTSILPPFPSFYWRGSLVEMIVANPAVIGALNETTTLSLSSADALVVSISRLEDILISKKTEVVMGSLADGTDQVRMESGLF
jgi:hypothetical protein